MHLQAKSFKSQRRVGPANNFRNVNESHKIDELHRFSFTHYDLGIYLMTIAELMLPELEREMAMTRKVLEGVPVDKLEWKANEKLHTLGWNANHLAEIVGWTKYIVDEDVFNVAPTDGPAYQTPALDDPAKILESFDENVFAARAAIASASDETMGKLWTMKAGEQTLMTLSKGECLRTWVLNHSVHHRGILSVYLRMLGVDGVSVYG